jgi:excisionase family DNA binding protein
MARPRKTVATEPVPVLLLRTDDAAIAIGCSRKTVYRLIARGQLSSVRVGSDLRVSLSALHDFIRDHTTQGVTPRR